MVYCTFFVHYSKKLKKFKIMTYTQSNSTSFLSKIFFSRMNNKKIIKRGAQLAALLFHYEVSMVVLINFIAILPTRHLFNTNC